MTPSHQIIEISICEPTHGDRKGVENKTKFYVSSRDVRIVCPRLITRTHTHKHANAEPQ